MTPHHGLRHSHLRGVSSIAVVSTFTTIFKRNLCPPLLRKYYHCHLVLVDIWRPLHPSQSNNDTIAFQEGQCPVLGLQYDSWITIIAPHHQLLTIIFLIHPWMTGNGWRAERWSVLTSLSDDQQVVTICTNPVMTNTKLMKQKHS